MDVASEDRVPYYFAVAQSTSAMIKFHYKELISALGSRTPAKKLASAIEPQMILGVASAVQRGNVKILKLALKLSEQQLGKCKLHANLLYMSVKLARKEVTAFLLKHGSDPLARWEGKLPEDAPFHALKSDLHFPDNNISDYEPCKALVRNARVEREEKNRISIQEAAKKEGMP